MPFLHACWVLTLLAAELTSAAPSSASAEASAAARAEAARLLALAVAGEPGIDAVQRAAEARATVSADEGRSWRSRARVAAMLPRLAAEYRHDERSLYASGVSSGQELDYLRVMPGDSVSVRLEWALEGLAFGRHELDAAAAAAQAAVRRAEAVQSASRLYHERLRLRVALAAAPPASGRARAEAEIELAAVTAQLHALTGLYEASR
jgi:hypothetical protein